MQSNAQTDKNTVMQNAIALSDLAVKPPTLGGGYKATP